MGTLREFTKKDGTKSYHAEVRLKGHAPERSCHRTLTLAKNWIQDTEAAIRDGRHFLTSEAKKHTVAELVDRFIEQWIPKYAKYHVAKIADSDPPYVTCRTHQMTFFEGQKSRIV